MTNQEMVENFLKKNGPSLSSEIVAYLIKKRNVSAVSARQAISRASKPVLKLTFINFPSKEKFVYLESQYDGDSYRYNLISKLVEKNTSYGKSIMAMTGQGGWIRKRDFDIYCGNPSGNIKGQLRSNVLLDRLLKSKVIFSHMVTGGEIILLDENAPAHLDIKIETELRKAITKVCFDWALRINFRSTTAASQKYASEKLPQFGFFNWDIVAPCYLLGLKGNQKGGNEEGFFAADVYLNQDNLNESQIKAFENKISIISSYKKGRRFIPALVHLGIDKKALMRLREKGVLLLEPRNFGDKTLGTIIKNLLHLMQDLRRNLANPEQLEKIINMVLNSDYGRLLNLPGPLFQVTIAYLFKLKGYHVDMGEIVLCETGAVEIDILLINNKSEVTAIEVKGYKKGKRFDRTEVETWIDKKRTRICGWYKAESKKRKFNKLSLKFIISTKFSNIEKDEFVEKAMETNKKFPTEFLDIDYVVNLAKEEGALAPNSLDTKFN